MKRALLSFLLVAAFLGALSLFEYQLSESAVVQAESSGETPSLGQLPEFEAIAHTGAPIDQDVLKGESFLMAFFFTSCQGVCPTLLSNIKKYTSQFEAEKAPVVLAFTVDPETDTPAVLAAYHKKRNLPENWVLARMSRPELKSLMDKIHLAIGDAPATHSSRVVAFDAEGQLKGYARGLDPETFSKSFNSVFAPTR